MSQRMFFTQKGNGEVLNISDAKIIHRNFTGRAGMYNREGTRSFSVILTEDEAQELLKRGPWNVRIRDAQGDDPNEHFCFLPVAVNYNNIPPRIYRVNKEKMTLLTEQTVGVLDTSDIVSCNIVINPRAWSTNGKSGIKAYCACLYAECEEDVFAERYKGLSLE